MGEPTSLIQSTWMHLRCTVETSHTVSQRHLKKGWFANLRDISKRADLQISETSPERLIKSVSSETSERSLRFSQRRLWVASETVIIGLQTKAIFGHLFIYLRVFIFFTKLNWYRKLLRAWFKLQIYLWYLCERI